MPFTQLVPHPFTSNSIEMYAPASSGVYGVSNAREWVYIGVADNIKGALLAHLRELQTTLMKREPTGFVYEPCEGGHRLIRQDRLVLEYEPTCNRQVSRHL